MTELDLTILYEDGEDGWIVASIPAVPGVLSQGRDRDEARENVLDALAHLIVWSPVDPIPEVDLQRPAAVVQMWTVCCLAWAWQIAK